MRYLKYIHQILTEEKKFYKFLICYAAIWGLVALFSFSGFIATGRSLIWSLDGYSQHYKALVYYGDFLRDAFSGHGHFYDFNISEGGDILHILNYYVIGDPLALLSIFVSAENMHILYSALVIIRLFLAGLSFIFMGMGLGIKNRYALLAGSLSYSFCMWTMFNANRHPFFINPMIYLPLIILGIEKIIKKERPYLFIVAFALAGASNFYFFQMIIIICVVYTTIRLILLFRRNIKAIIFSLLRVAGMAGIGICIAGVILIPVIMFFAQDSRTSLVHTFHLFYQRYYYSSLPAMLITPKTSVWLCMGFSVTSLLACFMLFFNKKKDVFLKILLAICLFLIIFPIGGRLFNVMSYETNRWSWTMALLMSYILTKNWEKLSRINKIEKNLLSICCIAFYIICLFFEKSRTAEFFSVLIIAFIILLISEIFYKKEKQIFILFLTIINIIIMAFWLYAPSAGNYVSEAYEKRRVNEWYYSNEAKALNELVPEGEFVRYSGKNIEYNIGMLNQSSSTDYFWTISNPYTVDFRTKLETSETTLNAYKGYDERTALLGLSSVNYLLTPKGDKAGIPYGFEKLYTVNLNEDIRKKLSEKFKKENKDLILSDDQKEKLDIAADKVKDIYINKFTLPLIYAYDNLISTEKWESMNAVQKQQAQLSAAYIGDEQAKVEMDFKNFSEDITDYKIPFEVKTLENQELSYEKNKRFITTKDNAEAKITFEKEENAEIYIEFKDFDFKATRTWDLYFGDEEVDPENLYNKTSYAFLNPQEKQKIKNEKKYWDTRDKSTVGIKLTTSNGSVKSLEYNTDEAIYTANKHDYIINLGYEEESAESVKLTFPNKGIYSMSEINVYKIPFDDYESQIENLKNIRYYNMEIGKDCLSADIETDKDKLICAAIPYFNGWSVRVDGQKEELCMTNERYLGVMVPAGRHTIEFYYERPYYKTGIFMTWMGIAGLGVLCVFTELRNKTFKKQKEELTL